MSASIEKFNDIMLRPFEPALRCAELADSYILKDKPLTSLHLCWIGPLNSVVSGATIAIAPICSLINCIASAIFAAIGLISRNDEWYQEAKTTFKFAVADLALIPYLFEKIFSPSLRPKEYLETVGLS